MILRENIEYLLEEVKEIYKEIHQNPELGFEEFDTSKLVAGKLREYGIEAKTVVGTGVIGTIYGGKPGKTIALRADMDALPLSEAADVPYASKNPQKMHACGHDAHTAMLLGASRYLSEHRDRLCGNVRLIFQPAEEGASQESLNKAVEAGGSRQGGAASMICAGALENVDLCCGLHVSSMMDMGKVTCCSGRAAASSDHFELTVQGKGGHGGSPDTAVDPTTAAAEIVLAYNALPAREINPLENCVVGVGTINTDSSWNIVPDWVKISGGVRTFNLEVREKICRRLKEIAEHICLAHNCTAVFERIEGYLPMICDPEAAEFMRTIARNVLGEDAVLDAPPMMGSEDMGYYLQKVPGAFMSFGIKGPEDECLAQHNPYFKVNLNALEIGTLLHINFAVSFLNQKE